MEYKFQFTGIGTKIESGAKCSGMMWGGRVQLNRPEVAKPFISPGLELAGVQSSLFGNTRSIYRCRSDSPGQRAENHSLGAVCRRGGKEKGTLEGVSNGI